MHPVRQVRGQVRVAVVPQACTPNEVCVPACREGLVAGGGFGGELVVQRVGAADKFACR